jgi:hypothetical protein
MDRVCQIVSYIINFLVVPVLWSVLDLEEPLSEYSCKTHSTRGRDFNGWLSLDGIIDHKSKVLLTKHSGRSQWRSRGGCCFFHIPCHRCRSSGTSARADLVILRAVLLILTPASAVASPHLRAMVPKRPFPPPLTTQTPTPAPTAANNGPPITKPTIPPAAAAPRT